VVERSLVEWGGADKWNPGGGESHTPYTKDVCCRFQESSSYVRTWLSAQPEVKEESLTDWLLYDVSKKVSSVVYRCFSRHQEARETGADWEWWFVFSKRSFCFRVQAKKAFPNSDNYPGLARTNQFGLQIDKLLESADEANAIALYALYSAEDLPTKCGKGHLDCHDGVFLAGALDLNAEFIQQARRPISSGDLLKRSIPFSCFGCCPLIHDMSGFLREYFSLEFETDTSQSRTANGESRPRGVHEQLPGYVSSLLVQRGELPDWWEHEFRSDLRGFNAILIQDFR
jgi:hypothetical protein